MPSSRYPAGPLSAGAAAVEITPQRPVHLSGDICRHRPARMVLDPLYARAAVFEGGGHKICFLSLDVTIVTAPYTRRIREAAAALGFDPDAVMVHATQTHAAPSLGPIMLDEDFPPLPPEFEWVGGADAEYSAWATERAIEAIRQADAALQPVRIGAGSGIEGRFAHNRRAILRDGSIGMPHRWPGPTGPTNIRYLEGPMDPEVGVFCAVGPTLRPVALLLHYTCHPVHGFPRPVTSADWPGAWADEMRPAAGDGCVPLVLNGCCGNINPWPPYDPDYVEDHRRMGRALATMAGKVMETLPLHDEGALDWAVRRLPIPLRPVPPAELEWATAILERQPQPAWADEAHTQVSRDWMVAASITSVELARRRSATLEYEIQVLRVGDTAFVGLPGEPFVEGQLAIKLASPAYPTYVAHCTSQYVGYIPIREALAHGGHEASTRYWAKLAPEALEMVVDAATGLLQEVFPA